MTKPSDESDGKKIDVKDRAGKYLTFVLADEESYLSDNYNVVYRPGRAKWNTNALKVLAKEHEFVANCLETGNPSVSFLRKNI